MESNWAAEHLQTIRTLMERSAVYRRALAPIMLFAGLTGLAATGLGLCLDINSGRGFCGLWLGAAVVAATGAFLLARRQAIKDHEPFWSPPPGGRPGFAATLAGRIMSGTAFIGFRPWN